MKIQKDVSLKPFHTFGIDVVAKRFAPFATENELKQGLALADKPILILGGGSNILFTKDFSGTILKNEIRFIRQVKEEGDKTYVRSGAGVNWHQFVLWTIRQGLGGIENLSLIPGTVGASPIQNIGAYGVEIKDVLAGVRAIAKDDLVFAGRTYRSGQVMSFSPDQCQLGYRDSIFKRDLKGKVIITSVLFRLTNHGHQLNTSYGAIGQYLAEAKIANPTIQDISQAVVSIRQSKLPDPEEVGNAGSFFKNPVVSKSIFQKLLSTYPTIPNYPAPNGQKKLAAGWLIQQAGWKGYRDGEVGCYPKQALVLANYGNATGQQVQSLARKIQRSVREKFGIDLEMEVNVI